MKRQKGKKRKKQVEMEKNKGMEKVVQWRKISRKKRGETKREKREMIKELEKEANKTEFGR